MNAVKSILILLNLKTILIFLCFFTVTPSSIGTAQKLSPAPPIVLQLETEISLRDLDWNFDSTLLAFVDADQDVTIINIQTGELDLRLKQVEGGRLAARNVAWSSTTNHLLIVNNVTKLWNYDESTLVDGFDFPAAITEDYTPVGNVDWHPTVNRFAILLRECEEGTPYRPGARVEIWDISTSTFTQIAGCVSRGYGLVKWNPQGTELAINGFQVFNNEAFVESEEIEIWNVDTRERNLTIPDLKNPSGLAWSPAGNMIAFTTLIGVNQFIQVRDANNGEIISQMEVVLGVNVPLDWHPSGNFIVTGGQDGIVRIWNALTGLQLIELPVHEDTVNDVSWSPDGNMLASVGRDGRLFIWSLPELLQ